MSVEARMTEIEAELKSLGWAYTESWHFDDGSTSITVYVPSFTRSSLHHLWLASVRAASKPEALIRAFRRAKDKAQDLGFYPLAEAVT